MSDDEWEGVRVRLIGGLVLWIIACSIVALILSYTRSDFLQIYNPPFVFILPVVIQWSIWIGGGSLVVFVVVGSALAMLFEGKWPWQL